MAGKYFEPNTPLMQNSDFYYPLTTVGQVILSDGRRLGGTDGLNLTPEDIGAVYVDENAIVGDETIGNNADTLGGHASDEFMLKTETAADSAKLGGKQPSAYALKSDITENALRNMVYLLAHPVGSYVWTSNSVNPGDTYGGTWEQVCGRFLLAAGKNSANTNTTYGILDANAIDRPAGEYGGVESRTLIESNIPEHYHDVAIGDTPLSEQLSGSEQFTASVHVAGTDVSTTGYYYNRRTAATGNGKAFNIMPPYLSAYCWHRLA